MPCSVNTAIKVRDVRIIKIRCVRKKHMSTCSH